MAATALLILLALGQLWMRADAQLCQGLRILQETGSSQVTVTSICFGTHTSEGSAVQCQTQFGATPLEITFSNNTVYSALTATCSTPANCPRRMIESGGLVNMEANITCTCPADPNVSPVVVPVAVDTALPAGGVLETGNIVTIGNHGCLPTGGSVIIDCMHTAGTPPFTYQWLLDFAILMDTDRMLMASQSGTYTCLLTNTNCGSSTSMTTITDQPAVQVSGPVCVTSGAIDLTCNITAGISNIIAVDTITMQWTDGLGFTSNNPTISVSVPGTYTCSATSSCGTGSDSITVQGAPAPVVLSDGTPARAIECLPAGPGGSIELECTILQGDPASVTVQWMGPSGSISGNPINASEVGMYTCTLSQPGCGQSDIAIDVITSPVLADSSGIQPGPVINIGGSTCLRSNPDTVINCTPMEGTAPFTYVWIQNGIQLPDVSPTLEPTSEGTYTCIVTNDCDSDQANSVIFGPPVVEILSNGMPAGNLLCLPGPGSTADLSCIVVSNDAPQVTVEWTDPTGAVVMGQPLGNTITVSGDDASSGTYTCTAVRPDCGSNSDSIDVAAFPVVEDSGMDVSGPDISIGENTILQANTTIFCASSSGTGPFTYEWSVDGVALSETSNVLAVDMPGTYTCIVSGLCGAADASTSVIQGIPPSISLPTDDPTMTVPTPPPNNMIFIGQDVCRVSNSDIFISCDTELGTPPITFSWRRDNVTIAGETGMTLAVRGSNSGTYTCIATNQYGSSVADTRILVPVDPIIQISISGGSKCDQLLRPEDVPPGVMNCALAGDDVVVTCTASDGSSDVLLMPNNGNNSVVRYDNIQAVAGDAISFMCNTSNSCGEGTTMETLVVYAPAVINIQTPLPPASIQGAQVIGAGRTDESVRVMPNSVLELYCPFDGVNTPNTFWTRVDPVTGAEVNISQVPNASTMLVNNSLILVIDPFNAANAGTYRCNTANIAGADSAEVVLRVDDPEPAEWVVTPWSTCDPYCHQGMRMRRVNCVGRRSGIPLPDSRCTMQKPLSWERCINLGPCFTSPVWDFLPWNQCNRACGGGTRWRYVFCVIPATREIRPNTECAGLTPPSSYGTCNTEPCCTGDRFGSYCRAIAGTPLCLTASYQRNCCWSCNQHGH